MKSSYKIIIVGDSCVGKTSLMKRYITRSYGEKYKSTIGVEFLSKTIQINNELKNIQIWDTAGSERFYSMNKGFYRGADACIVMFDLTNMNSFMNLEKWIDEFLIIASPEKPESFPFVIIGNKVDLQKERRINSNMIDMFCSSKNINYFETSSKLNINIDNALENLINKILEHEKFNQIKNNQNNQINQINQINKIDLNKKNLDKNNYCYCL